MSAYRYSYTVCSCMGVEESMALLFDAENHIDVKDKIKNHPEVKKWLGNNSVSFTSEKLERGMMRDIVVSKFEAQEVLIDRQ